MQHEYQKKRAPGKEPVYGKKGTNCKLMRGHYSNLTRGQLKRLIQPAHSIGIRGFTKIFAL